MRGLGSGENGEFTFIDWIAILGLWISIQNLDLNLTQEDKQELEEELTREGQELLDEIHSHLTAQDEKIDKILQILEVNKNADN